MSSYIAVTNSGFPSLLQEISEKPAGLYYKGTWEPNLFSNCLAVVGSRHMSQYGKEALAYIFSGLAKEYYTIVSGFMVGVDAWAHQCALDCGFKTIAIMPCGIETIFPTSQEALYARILANGGLVISEYPGNSAPRKWTYPRRNRLVAGLSKATLVIESTLNSGSLITANYAHTYKRKVFSLPGNIFGFLQKGNHYLLKNFAQVLDSGEDINAFFKTPPVFVQQAIFPANPQEDLLLTKLAVAPRTLEELSLVLAMPVASLCTKLAILTVNGQVYELGGRFYVCKS